MRNYTKIPNEMFEASQISIPGRYLYTLLLKYCGKDEYCFPSQETLAKIMCYSSRQIRTLLKELERLGLVRTIRKGWNRSNNYLVAKTLQFDRKSGSSLIGSTFPFHKGNTVPPKSTYLKGKGKRSIKGLENMRDIAERFRKEHLNGKL